jgi:hypothetical protein
LAVEKVPDPSGLRHDVNGFANPEMSVQAMLELSGATRKWLTYSVGYRAGLRAIGVRYVDVSVLDVHERIRGAGGLGLAQSASRDRQANQADRADGESRGENRPGGSA